VKGSVPVGSTGPASGPKPQQGQSGKPGGDGGAQVDLNRSAPSTVAGEWVGDKPGLGLTGLSDIAIAWREPIADRAFSFCVGDFVGDGSPRVAYVQRDGPDSVLRISRWDGRQFRTTYRSDPLFTNVWTCRRIPPVSGRCSISITVGSGYPPARVFGWDGTTYRGGTARLAVKDISVPRGVVVAGTTVTDAAYIAPEGPIEEWPDRRAVEGGVRTTAEDFDGDGELEFVFAGGPYNPESRGVLQVLDHRGRRKHSTDGEYKAGGTSWLLPGAKNPWIVAQRTNLKRVDDTDQPDGGTIHLIVWDGEEYKEVWRSKPLDKVILDLQVCDPKGEGQFGLVALSYDGKRSWLTKFVPVP